MTRKVRNLILTESQEACLDALRSRKESKTDIAIRAKLDLKKAEKALEVLKELGLAKRDEMNRWRFTRRGRDCRFKTIPDRIRRSSALPGPGARRLLDILDRPMRGSELAESLGITLQRVRQLVVKLHAQGFVKFGDPERILEVVSRTKDKTVLLSRNEALVLSAIPDAYATNVAKIRLAALLPEKSVQEILDSLVARGFVVAQNEFTNDAIYQVTAAGSKHPQCRKDARLAHAPRLPVESDRVSAVLSAIYDARSIRIRDLKNELRIPHPSINALMQYLKRKALVQKTGQEQAAPYCLTGKGLAALTEMARRHAA
jgi:DNA-binding IclR family transcriptional regulator/DNA-binding MarR family transcriptional regulator